MDEHEDMPMRSSFVNVARLSMVRRGTQQTPSKSTHYNSRIQTKESQGDDSTELKHIIPNEYNKKRNRPMSTNL